MAAAVSHEEITTLEDIAKLSPADFAELLFDWINNFLDTNRVQSVTDINDGLVLWEVLQKVDFQSFILNLPEQRPSERWIPRWNNLNYLFKQLTTFLEQRCEQQLPLPGGFPDLEAMARTASMTDTVKLIKLVIVAAIKCHGFEQFLERTGNLSVPTQLAVVTVFRDSEQAPSPEEDPQSETVAIPPAATGGLDISVDSELALEARVGTVMAENDRLLHEKTELRTQIEDMGNRNTRLQQGNNTLEEQLRETKGRLSALLEGRGDLRSTKELEQRHKAVVEELEERAMVAEEEVDSLKRASELLRIKAEKAQKLQDEYDEIKTERDQLSRKANAVDKYKQKVEASQDLDKENQTLKAKILDFQRQLTDSDSTKAASSDLRRANEEYRRLLPSIEQDRNEQSAMRKKVELDLHVLQAQWEDAQEQLAKGQAANEDLRSRLQEYENNDTPTFPQAIEGAGLDFVIQDEDLTHPEPENGGESTLKPFDDQNYVSEDELRSIISAMRAQAQDASRSGKRFNIDEEKKLAYKIENNRNTMKQMAQVIDTLAQSGIDPLVIKDLNERHSFRHRLPGTQDDTASLYASANPSLASLALSTASSRASASSHKSSNPARKTTGIFGMFK